MDEAIQLLQTLQLTGGDSTPEKHPEKRMRAAWAAFEEAELPALTAEKPGLKRQQARALSLSPLPAGVIGFRSASVLADAPRSADARASCLVSAVPGYAVETVDEVAAESAGAGAGGGSRSGSGTEVSEGRGNRQGRSGAFAGAGGTG